MLILEKRQSPFDSQPNLKKYLKDMAWAIADWLKFLSVLELQTLSHYMTIRLRRVQLLDTNQEGSVKAKKFLYCLSNGAN